MSERLAERLTGEELAALVRRVFLPRPGEADLGLMIDLPDAKVPDDAKWLAQRETALEWVTLLSERRDDLGFDTHLILYPNVHTNNGNLPERAWLHAGAPLPERGEDLDPATSIPLEAIYASHSMFMALTRFSSTAPLKMAAKVHPIRAATMPGFRSDMIPALRLDYTEVNRRVQRLKGLLDRATGANLRFAHPGGDATLHLDLRWRSGHASGGLLPEPGAAGNLPSGEAYIVPYEGEGEPSLSQGTLPVQFGSEIVLYRIAGNKAVEVLSEGPRSAQEAAHILKEPAYANLAELGLGVLAAFGVKPIGEVLLDEKLGVHIAFGRSEHFGGQVGPQHFSSPEAVIHIDRVYVPETQPDVKVLSLDLRMDDGADFPLLRNGDYVLDWAVS